MKVFKLFFKLMRKYAYNFTMYMGIFCGVLFGGVLPNMDNGEGKQYINPRVTFALLDNDDSFLSKAFAQYIEEKHDRVEVRTFEEDVLRDDIYARYICSAVIIEKGFEEEFIKNSNGKPLIKIYDIPDNTSAVAFRNGLEDFLTNVRMFLEGDPSIRVEDAVARAKDLLSASVDVSYMGGEKIVRPKAHFFYQYLPWILVLMMVVAITPVLARLGEERLRKRIYASPYKFTRMNTEIYLAMLLLGLFVCAVMFVIASILLPAYSNVGLYVINMLALMLVALSLTFLFSKFISNDMIISLVGNLASLGMSFLCGVFVPQSVMSPGILTVARFMPAYWYVKALDMISAYKPGDLSSIIGCIGIEVLFALVLFGAGLYAAKLKRVRN